MINPPISSESDPLRKGRARRIVLGPCCRTSSKFVPPNRRTDATVVLPGSKSLTNRAVILAALASNPVVLQGALWREDAQAMVYCLKRLGFCIAVADDPAEPANHTLTV
jgi:3-phosphoshikimate 1-carboxyvinyltransferase